MGLNTALTRGRHLTGAGTLGTIERSIGYLQGGYKDSTIHSKVQLFNTITQTGSLVYDTGYQRNYRPGISGNYNGYFSTYDSIAYSKFNYINATASASFSTVNHPSVTASDLNIYTQAWILCTATASWSGSGVTDWVRLTLATDTPVNYGTISSNPEGMTRQALSTGNGAFFLNMNVPNLTILNYSNLSVVNVAGISAMDTGMQIPCGMSVNDTFGYIVGYIGRNVRVNMSGLSILSYAVATPYTYNFGESHSIASSTSGYMMAGYADTTGRYGGTQHGLCQKITLSNEAITTLPDLVLAQSSGQMMQGF